MWVLSQPWSSQYTSCRVVWQNLPCADPAVRFSGNPRVIDFCVLCSLARSVVAIFIDCTRWTAALLHACPTVRSESHNFAGQLHVWAVRTHMDSRCAVLSLEMLEWHGQPFSTFIICVSHKSKKKIWTKYTQLFYLKWPPTASLRIQYICFCSWYLP